MKSQAGNIKNSIVDTTWNQKDTDIVVQHYIDKKLKLEPVEELSGN